ncbi:MAG: potassium transporter, partial [Muribaculum sp.]|nr:potassium transporter [Muribaculum sp.]
LFFSGGQSVYSQLLVKDMIYSKSMNALLPTLLYILTFTLTVEIIGAGAIWLIIHDIFFEMDIATQIKTSLFLSLSSFCNAGFSTLPDGMANARLMNSNQSIYIVVSIIVLAGSIGFPVLVNVRDACHEYLRRIWNRLRHRQMVGRQVRLYNVNTKISVYTTISIFIISTILFWLMESDNTLAGFSVFDQWVQSVFNATIPRSSGFQSVAPSGFMPSTLVMIMVLMWIGGASQSTAGGVKVNTVATLWLNMKSVVLGRHRVVSYNRTISDDSTRRAITVVSLSMIFFFIYSIVLLNLEPTLQPKAVIFEVVSALFTVGSSMGVTASLSTTSKAILCTAMFLGRVGIMSLLIGINGNRSDKPVRYPSENIIIN